MHADKDMSSGSEVSEVRTDKEKGQKSRRLAGLRSGLAVGAIATGLVAGLGIGTAGATVANNGNAMAYANVDGTGCQIVVGDQASPVRATIGETDVTRCSHNYSLVIRTYLDFIPAAGGSPRTVAENQGSAVTYQADVATNNYLDPYGLCGNGYWETVADVSFNGGATWTGLLGSYGGYKPFDACG